MKTPRKRCKNPRVPFRPWSQAVEAKPVVEFAPKAKAHKSSSPLEKEIEKKVCDYARRQGCYVRKFTSPQQRGVPDRIIIAPGGAVGFLELKAAGKKPTKLQMHEMGLLVAVDANVAWCDSVLDGKQFVDRLIDKGQKGDGWA